MFCAPLELRCQEFDAFNKVNEYLTNFKWAHLPLYLEQCFSYFLVLRTSRNFFHCTRDRCTIFPALTIFSVLFWEHLRTGSGWPTDWHRSADHHFEKHWSRRLEWPGAFYQKPSNNYIKLKTFLILSNRFPNPLPF